MMMMMIPVHTLDPYDISLTRIKGTETYRGSYRRQLNTKFYTHVFRPLIVGAFVPPGFFG